MRGVVLAAGFGQRLRPLTLETPKVRPELGGHPLIHYSLEALKQAGVSDIAIVAGYQANKLLGALARTHPEVQTIFNGHYAGGNALSVYTARSFVEDEPFIVCLGDHPISPEIVHSLMSSRNHSGYCILCIDIDARHPFQLNDATRVLVDDARYITSMGKQLKAWNAIDIRVFMMTPEVFPVLDHYVDTLILLGLTIWPSGDNPGTHVWPVGFLAPAGSFAATYTRARLENLPRDVFDRGITSLASRDVRLFVVMVGTVSDQGLATLIVLASMTNVVVLISVVYTRRLLMRT